MFISKCRMCSGSSFYKFLDLGEMPPADQFLYKHQLPSTQNPIRFRSRSATTAA